MPLTRPGDGATDRHRLALPTGELGNRALGGRHRDADTLEIGVSLGIHLLLRQKAKPAQNSGQQELATEEDIG